MSEQNAPRVTPEQIEANIAEVHYFTAADAIGIEEEDHPLQLLTFCVLVMKNGYTVVGKSACASPENFDAQLGQRIAREDAAEQIWPLLGYELKSHLHAIKRGH